MAKQLFANNATGYLNSSITNVATSIVLQAGQGATFPSPTAGNYFYATLYDGVSAIEIVKVTARSTDTLTVTRAQEGTTGQAFASGSKFEVRVTAAGLNNLLQKTGDTITDFTVTGQVTSSLADGTAPFVVTSTTQVNNLNVQYLQGKTWAVPGSIGSTTPAAGAFTTLSASGISATDDVTINGTTTNHSLSVKNSTAGSLISLQSFMQDGYLNMTGTGSLSVRLSSGYTKIADFTAAGLAVTGTLSAGNGTFGAHSNILLTDANASTSYIISNADATTGTFYGTQANGPVKFLTNNTTVMTLDNSGNLLVGKTVQDTSTVGFSVAGGGAARCVLTGTATLDAYQFYRAGGANVGTITCTATTTSYNTTSDKDFKIDEGVATSTDVLKNTVVHDGRWKADNSVDRFVFAQEAYLIKPTAVSVGNDEVDENGNKIRPWGVDYSKYVPDLIVGWQDHESRIQEQQAQIQALTARLEKLENSV
jgi:hypothetical protein